ncbi:MAG: hypothetical protein LQ340_000225 [Diploschistes diacapsis]|nr:MAG: hypothetical protein LQ340_000225 [Diploschistes diacapsis]
MALLNRTPRLFHTSKPFILSSTSPLRAYATTPNSPPRRAVTIVNDTGQTPWTALSKREKVARTTQQTLNLGIVALGFVMTGGVAYLLYTTVFSPDSKYSHFNRAVTEVKGNAECRELLGPAGKIRAYGESSWNRWSRNRAVAADVRRDRTGGEHFFMKFYVSGFLVGFVGGEESRLGWGVYAKRMRDSEANGAWATG